ncbi:hypothetical protein IWQ62_000054 [Dispira parvispora]|uniref:Uncharacterized protein n=1 Tax=Dispira parvispora TaxID=1520584 RepID=A0A9W8E9K9_9FUNG|nr:hypothetical protein IWQ62_000054 [Dispira parvispora]
MSESSHPVQLYVYDLSQGMARSLSPQLVGRVIEGIWHTSVVAFGIEFFYGQGIQRVSPPGTTHHGRPLRQLSLGSTQVPPDVLDAFLTSLSQQRYTAERYHILDHNCNHFSAEVTQFLTGQDIPAYIRDLPQEFMSTPLGQSLLPLLEGHFGPSQLGQSSASVTPAHSSLAASNVVSHLPTLLAPRVYRVTTVKELDSLTRTFRGVVVLFTSATCPPCRMIEPEFHRLMAAQTSTVTNALDGSTTAPRVVGAQIDMSTGFAVAQKYEIRATPTFLFLLDRVTTSRLQGAQPKALASEIDLLEYSTHPPVHPHRVQVKATTLAGIGYTPILYNQQAGVVKAVARYQTLEAVNEALPPTDPWTPVWQAFTTAVTAPEGSACQPQSLIDSNLIAILQRVYNAVPDKERFPLVDMIRYTLAGSPRLRQYLESPQGEEFIRHVFTDAMNVSDTTLARPLLITTLKLGCNVFSSDYLMKRTRFGVQSDEGLADALTRLLVHTLLWPDTVVRQTAASLAFNMGAWVAACRHRSFATEGGQQCEASKTVSTVPKYIPTEWQESGAENWLMECVSAVADALTKETHEPTAFRLVAALGQFLFTATATLLQLADVLGVVAAAQALDKIWVTETRGPSLAKELVMLIQTVPSQIE